MSAPIIDPEFRDLLPPLETDAYAKLEAGITEDGCREPLMIWQGLIVDGHHRFDICTRLGLPFQTNYLDAPDRDSAMLWMLRNQGGRRNTSDIDRIKMAAKVEEITARKAKERQGTRTDLQENNILAKSPESEKPVQTRKESAKAAGVGEKKYDEGKVILEAVATGEAAPEVLADVRAGKVSIHKAATAIKKARKPKATRKPSVPSVEDIQKDQQRILGNLKAAWVAATSSTRKDFLEWVEKNKTSTNA